jgi:orotidine-5'-phosphate decarboxylase
VSCDDILAMVEDREIVELWEHMDECEEKFFDGVAVGVEMVFDDGRRVVMNLSRAALAKEIDRRVRYGSTARDNTKPASDASA